MRFGEDVLVEIMAVIQDALLNEVDASDGLRNIEIEEKVDPDKGPIAVLTQNYLGQRKK